VEKSIPLPVRKLDGSLSGQRAVACIVGRGTALLIQDLARLPEFGRGMAKVTLYGMEGKAALTMVVHVSSDGGPALVSPGSLRDGFCFVKVGGGLPLVGQVLLRR
jgi:hypothetical protein